MFFVIGVCTRYVHVLGMTRYLGRWTVWQARNPLMDAVADLVADAIAAVRFWAFTDPRFISAALGCWQRVAERDNPEMDIHFPGLQPIRQLAAGIQRLLAAPGGGS